eukprot:792406-Karenia_brevis.AAC.1
MEMLQTAFNEFTLKMQDGQDKAFEECQGKFNSNLQSFGQKLLLNVTEILEARIQPVQKMVDEHTRQLDHLQWICSQLEGKLEQMGKQME